MIKAFLWIIWLQLADLFFVFRKKDETDSIDNYSPIFTNKTPICPKCHFYKTTCKSKMVNDLTEKYGDCIFSNKQHYYVKYK